MASFQTNLTVQQVQAAVDALRLAYLSGTVEVRFSDGKSQRFDSLDKIRVAIQDGEDWIRQMSGQGTGNSVSFAQHKRGDGPCGPGRLFGTW